MPDDPIALVTGLLQGILSSTGFILALFIGFCVLLGFTKTKRTSGGSGPVVKSLDETITHKSFHYLKPTDPHGPANQLHAPELVEKNIAVG